MAYNEVSGSESVKALWLTMSKWKRVSEGIVAYNVVSGSESVKALWLTMR